MMLAISVSKSTRPRGHSQTFSTHLSVCPDIQVSFSAVVAGSPESYDEDKKLGLIKFYAWKDLCVLVRTNCYGTIVRIRIPAVGSCVDHTP